MITRIHIVCAAGLATLCNTTAFAGDTDPLAELAAERAAELRAQTATSPWDEIRASNVMMGEALALAEEEEDPKLGRSCLTFASWAYRETYRADFATAKAIDACDRIRSMEVTRAMYDVFHDTLGPQRAMDEAVKWGSNPYLVGKGDIVRYAARIYERELLPASAARRAASMAAAVTSADEKCIRRSYRRLHANSLPDEALDAAFLACARR